MLTIGRLASSLGMACDFGCWNGYTSSPAKSAATGACNCTAQQPASGSPAASLESRWLSCVLQRLHCLAAMSSNERVDVQLMKSLLGLHYWELDKQWPC